MDSTASALMSLCVVPLLEGEQRVAVLGTEIVQEFQGSWLFAATSQGLQRLHIPPRCLDPLPSLRAT